jgi:hypothetical protein
MTLHLPALLLEIAQVIGEDAACQLAAELGGTRVYVAKTPTEGSLLVDAIGADAARRLAVHYGGEHLLVPNAKQQLVAWLNRRGCSNQEIARRLHMNERSVRRILDRPAQERQGCLPF